MEILRKITLRNIGLDIATLKGFVKTMDEGTQKAICRVVGIAAGYKTGQTDKGEYVALIGEFTAANQETGASFSASKCILPTFIAEAFVPVLQQHGNAEFALEIGIKADSKAVAGYTFTMRPLIESKTSDRMADLLKIAASAPALPAPATSSESTPKAPKAAKSGKAGK